MKSYLLALFALLMWLVWPAPKPKQLSKAVVDKYRDLLLE